LAKSLVAGLAGLGLVGVVAGPLAPAALAESGRFELTGPDLRITVTRAGKELPLGAVPSLAEGDILHIAASLPGDQSAHLMVVSAFLRGATNPPPREWIGVARTWRDKPAEQTLTLTVPKGARQMVVLVVPDTRGAQGALVDAVRGKPGEFVRASQDLNQASLDHARLDAFIAAVRADSIAHPQGLRKIAPVLAHSLSIKLNEDCLDKIAEQQASCLVENREALVLTMSTPVRSPRPSRARRPIWRSPSAPPPRPGPGSTAPISVSCAIWPACWGPSATRNSATCPRLRW
jgi:hypothetical protein